MEIIATIGVFTEDKSKDVLFDRVSKAREAGINTIRINIANINYDYLEHMKELLLHVRNCFYDVKLLIDLPYPKHKPRTNILSDKKPMVLKKDDLVFFCVDDLDYKKYAYKHQGVQVTGVNNLEKIIEREEFYYDDGKGCFCIQKVINEKCFFATAISDFILYQNKSFPIASINKMEDIVYENLIKFFFAIKPEILAGSFVESVDEINEFRKKFYFDYLFMSKIETQKALNMIVEITKESDAIMVARGDLGFNISIDLFCATQNRIINVARDLNKPVYAATDILSSLQYRRVPSRADIIDLNILKECNVNGIIISAFIEDILNAKKYIDSVFK